MARPPAAIEPRLSICSKSAAQVTSKSSAAVAARFCPRRSKSCTATAFPEFTRRTTDARRNDGTCQTGCETRRTSNRRFPHRHQYQPRRRTKRLPLAYSRTRRQANEMAAGLDILPTLNMPPNPSANRTACKLRLQVPTALRAPAADYLRRYASAIPRASLLVVADGS